MATQTISLDDQHNKKLKIIEAVRGLKNRTRVICYLADKELEQNPNIYPAELFRKQ